MLFSKISNTLDRFDFTLGQKIYYRNILSVVLVIIGLYSLFYFFMGAKLAALLLAAGAIFGLPIAFLLEKNNHPTASRFVFISVSLLAVYSSHLGFREDIFVEFYFIPGIMLALLLFEPHQKPEIFLGWALPIIAWIFTRWGPKATFPDSWYATSVSSEMFRNINFIGAVLLSVIFLWQYATYLLALKRVTLDELENSKIMQRQLENAQRMAKIGDWSFELKSHKLSWSKELYRIYDLPTQNSEELYEIYRKMFYEEDVRILDAAIKNTLKTGVGYEIEFRILLNNGEVKFLLGRGEVVKNKNGEPVSLFGTVQDITEAKKISEAYYSQQKKLMASAKMASLGEMAGGVAHEINSPLAVIQGKSHQIISKLENSNFDIQKIKLDLEKIIQTTDRIAKIINGLSAFSRNANQDPMVEVQAYQTIEEVLDFCSARFKNHGVSLEIDVPRNITLECRSVQIAQVLLNLIYNSFDAVQSLEQKWIRIYAKEFSDQVEIRITDSGLGISDEITERMMNPFFTTKELGKGTGLGLSVSLGIIEDHRGKLNYDPTSQNTTFIILLPRKQKVTQKRAC